MKLNTTILAVLTASIGAVSASSIAMNFAENASNQVFAGGALIGPTSIDSTNWNNSIGKDSGSLGTGEIGTVNTLIDDTGATTITTIAWASGGVYYNGDGIVGDEAKLAVGYLDDGGAGPSFTLSNIPYANYSIYVLFTSDNNGDYTHSALTVGGTDVFGGDFNAHGRVTDGTGWVESDGSAYGNYAKVDGLTTSTLTVGSVRNGDARGPITGFVIVEVPEPSSAALLGLGGLALILRRRK